MANMNETMAVKLMDIMKPMHFYKEGYTADLCKRLTIMPVITLEKFFGLGEEYVPFNMTIRKLILDKYEKETGCPLYDETDLNSFPEYLVKAFDEDIVILKYVEAVVRDYLLRNCNESNMEEMKRVKFLLSSNVERNVAGGLMALQFYNGEIPYMMKRSKAISNYFSSQLEKAAAGTLTADSFDKLKAIKELFALTDELEIAKSNLTDIINRLKVDGIYTEPTKLIENRPTVEYVATLGVFKMSAALEELYELTDKCSKTNKIYEKLKEQLKTHGFDPEKLIGQRTTIEAAWKILDA